MIRAVLQNNVHVFQLLNLFVAIGFKCYSTTTNNITTQLHKHNLHTMTNYLL